MEIPEELAERTIESGEIRLLYDVFVEFLREDYPEEYETIRYGIKMHFDIHDLWEEPSPIYIKHKQEKVIIGTKCYRRKDFRSEKEDRKALIVKLIMDNVEDKSGLGPRE